MLTTLAIIISIIIFFAYLTYVLVKCKAVPKSLSETYYLLGDKGWLFSLSLTLMGLSLMPAFIEISDSAGHWYTFLSFFTCAAIIFVGYTPKFKQQEQAAIHVVAASIAAAAGIIWSLLTIWYIPVISIFVFIAPIIIQWKTAKVFWLEMLAFFCVYASALVSSLI